MASILPKIFKRKKQEKKDTEGKQVKTEIRAEKATGRQKKEIRQLAEEVGIKTPGHSNVAFKVLINPRITEKTTDLSGAGIYTFNVFSRASKVLIKKAVEELYEVKVKKVRLANMPQKTKIIRGKRGRRPGYKKALVYLKEGEKIEFI